MANWFVAFEPLAGWRHVEVTERKTSTDFARFLRVLSDEHSAEAERIVLVCDNLSTHSPAALYEAFEPAEARRLAERFEWHYTPKHGSWLNVAEMELRGVPHSAWIAGFRTWRRCVGKWPRGRKHVTRRW